MGKIDNGYLLALLNKGDDMRTARYYSVSELHNVAEELQREGRLNIRYRDLVKRLSDTQRLTTIGAEQNTPEPCCENCADFMHCIYPYKGMVCKYWSALP